MVSAVENSDQYSVGVFFPDKILEYFQEFSFQPTVIIQLCV